MNLKSIIDNKVNNKKWTYEEIDYVVNSFTFDKISEKEMSNFIKLIYWKGLTFKETLYLTNAMIKTGEIIKFDNIDRTIVDKHSTGGVGDKITLIVAPIVAANGLGVAKMSGRSLGLTGGTIDKLESIEGYNVNLNKEKFMNLVNDIGVSVISQTEKIAIADKKIYALRDKIGAVNSIPLIASSIMSKKIASGSSVIIIDLKVGAGAFMKDLTSARKLAKTMIKIGKYWNKKVIVILSDMNSPLGNFIGNTLEVKETIDFFDGKREKRLETLSLTIASYMISLGKNISYTKAQKMSKEVLKNGKAKEVFNIWIKKQGGNLKKLKDNAKTLDIKSDKSGYIEKIDAEKIAVICNELGTGRASLRENIDYAVGIELKKTLGSKVNIGDTLATVYYNNPVREIEQKVKETFKINSILKKEKNIIIEVIK